MSTFKNSSLLLFYGFCYVFIKILEICVSIIFYSRSRMHHTSYLKVAHDISNHELFKQWVSDDATNNNDIKILLLGHIWGDGGPSRTLKRLIISVLRVSSLFLNSFIDYGRIVHYYSHITSALMNTVLSEIKILFVVA